MSLLKYSQAVAILSLSTLCSISQAAVEDLGMLDSVTAKRTEVEKRKKLTDAEQFGWNVSADRFSDSQYSTSDFRMAETIKDVQFKQNERKGKFDSAGFREKIKRNDQAHTGSAYTQVASPVPEPETYAMIIAGLALIGLTARRRNQA